MYLRKRTTSFLRNTTNLPTRTLSCTNWMKSWTWHLSRWNKSFRLLRRNTRRSWTSFRKSALSATTWLRWTYPISLWLMTKWMLVSMQPLTLSLLQNPSCNNNRRRISNHQLLMAQQIRLWRTRLSLVIRETTPILHLLHLNCSNLWMTSITKVELLSTPQFKMVA